MTPRANPPRILCWRETPARTTTQPGQATGRLPRPGFDPALLPLSRWLPYLTDDTIPDFDTVAGVFGYDNMNRWQRIYSRLLNSPHPHERLVGEARGYLDKTEMGRDELLGWIFTGMQQHENLWHRFSLLDKWADLGLHGQAWPVRYGWLWAAAGYGRDEAARLHDTNSAPDNTTLHAMAAMRGITLPADCPTNGTAPGECLPAWTPHP